MARPRSNPQMNEGLEKAQEQFDAFDKQIKDLTIDQMNTAPVQEEEPQTKLSSKEIDSNNYLHLKPKRAFPPGVDPKTGKVEQFNEKFRKEWEFAKEKVCFIAENKEIIGEALDIWTKSFPGVNCEEWDVPVNKPVVGPRYLAEQIKRKYYHRLIMEDKPVSVDGAATYYGTIAVKSTIQRLDAYPVREQKSIFMASSF